LKTNRHAIACVTNTPKFEPNTSFFTALEEGRKWRLIDKLLLYAGAFFDFGLNNAANANRTPLCNHIAVEHLTGFKLLEFSNKMDLISVGIILRLAFFREPPKRGLPQWWKNLVFLIFY